MALSYAYRAIADDGAEPLSKVPRVRVNVVRLCISGVLLIAGVVLLILSSIHVAAVTPRLGASVVPPPLHQLTPYHDRARAQSPSTSLATPVDAALIPKSMRDTAVLASRSRTSTMTGGERQLVCELGRGVCVEPLQAPSGVAATFVRTCKQGFSPSACRCVGVRADADASPEVIHHPFVVGQSTSCSCTFLSRSRVGTPFWLMSLDCISIQ